jgi:hypothetical protein
LFATVQNADESLGKGKTMASKATILRQKSSEKVAAAGRTHCELIGDAVKATYGDSVGPAAVTLVTALVDDLEAKAVEMVRYDEAHEEELRDDPEVRERRDTCCRNLVGRLVESREQLTTIGGPDYAAKLGFSGKIPVDPVEVLRLGQTVMQHLTKVTPPASRIPGHTMDPELWRAPIAASVAEMEGLTVQVAEEEREAEATLTSKYASIEAYDRAFSRAANLVSTLLEIAGQKELAKRVRPSTRRSGQTTEDAPSEGSTPTTPAA